MAFLKIKRSDLKFGRELGVGGFGTVYQAILKRSLLKRQAVAVKRLNSAEQTRELEILPQLDHTNIIKLYGVVDERPDLFLVMELCEGGSVREYLNDFKGKRLPFDQFCDWVKQAALPIQYLKMKKIVHKDIKTPNYLIAKDGRTLKLGDFGLARKVVDTMSNATSTASYAWMAPELFIDNKLSLNYDIFSFGVVVWEFWTTEYPHRGLEPQVIAWRVCQEKQRLLIPNDCLEPLADFLRMCWDFDWKVRPNIDHVVTLIEDVKAEAAAIQKATQRRILEGSWELEKVIGEDGPGKLEYPSGIAVNSNADTVAVTDSNADQVQVYSAANLQHRLTLDTQAKLAAGWSYPPSVQVDHDDMYYVTDSREFVLMFAQTGEYDGKWPAVSPQGISSDAEDTCLECFTMDIKGQILVGEINKKYISIHQPGGSHVASIKVDIAPWSLAVTSQGTIVISNFVNKVHIVDSEGQLLHDINQPNHVHIWDPKGVTCFADIICFCNYENKSIHCHSVSGKYLTDLPISLPGKNDCLAFTPDGRHLCVSYFDYTSHNVGVYKLH